MKYQLLRSLVGMTTIAAGAVELAKAIINTFSFDIFAGCVDGTLDVAGNTCQYGPQVSINVLAGLFFFAFGAILMSDDLRKITRATVTKFAVLAIALFLMLTFVWRLQVSLQDNFQLFAGPETFTEYLYVAFVWADVVLIGGILGFFAWISERSNAFAKNRKEPRTEYKKK